MAPTTLKQVPDEELLHGGNLACAGCPEILAFRHVLKALGRDTIVVNSTGCLAVVTQMGVPKVPHFHVLLENGPAVMSGIDAGLRMMGRREGTNLLVVAGDGATADIGLAALSASIERGEDFIYVCFDNESYMNTGGQRSGTTPFGARTSTTPIGTHVRGEQRVPGMRKDMMEIVAAHRIPYAASCSIAYPLDLIERVRRAAAVRGPSYVHVHCPCPTGWGMSPAQTIQAAKLAVQTGCVALWELEEGTRRPTKRVGRRTPVIEYLRMQKRFAHLTEDSPEVAAIQADIDARWAAPTT